MTPSVTFNGTTVGTRRITHQQIEGLSGNLMMEMEFECIDTSGNQIAALNALIGPIRKTRLLNGKFRIQNPLGTSGSLVVNGTTYTSCSIESLTVDEVFGSQFGVLKYMIKFARHTA